MWCVLPIQLLLTISRLKTQKEAPLVSDLNGPPRPLFICFSLFKQTLQFLQQINVKKCLSSIQCWDLNPPPSEHEPPPITTPKLLRQLGDATILVLKTLVITNLYQNNGIWFYKSTYANQNSFHLRYHAVQAF